MKTFPMTYARAAGFAAPGRLAESVRPNSSRTSLRWVVAFPGMLALAASAVSVYFGYATLYNDAKSHLNIARHVTDSLTPGLAQLGSVWLPLPHLLLVPLVANDALWHSGAAGAVVGGAAFVYSAVRLFALVEGWTGSRVAAWCALAAYITNLNLLYLQSTALTEPVLLATVVGATFHLSQWLRTRSYRDLLAAALLTQAATISRYDGWFFLLIVSTIVAVMAWRWTRRQDVVEASVLAYTVLAGYGIVLWIIYNAVIFGDPLYFLHSVYSAQAQQQATFLAGKLPSKGNLWWSAQTFAWAAFDVCGPVLTLLGAVGWLLVIAWPGRIPREASVALLFALASPAVFNVVSLYLGQSALQVPQLPPYGWFNDRYGIVTLPLLAAGAGALGVHLRHAWLALPVGLASTAALILAVGQPVIIVDGREGLSGANSASNVMAASYLKANYHGGEVLADDYLSSSAMFLSGIPLRDFVTVGSKPYYADALMDPSAHVVWIVRHSGDDVDHAMTANPERFAAFEPLYATNAVTVYYLRRAPI